MVCRTTRIGSAITSYARLQSGLLDQQTLSTFHELLREGRSAQQPTTGEVNTLIDCAIRDVRSNTNLSEARVNSLISRLEAARTQPMDGRTYYAANRLVSRTQLGREALDTHLDAAARVLGTNRAEVAAYLNSQIAAADDQGRGAAAPTEFRRTFAAENPHVPFDRATAYALHALQTRVQQHQASQPSRPTVERHFVNSSVLHEMGYDPSTGRCEVTMRSNPERVYAYRLTPTEYEAWRNASSLGSYFTRNIRGNPAHQYRNTAEATSAGTQTQCSTCGQFADDEHACPVRDSVEERNATARAARNARTTQPAPTPPRRIGARSGLRTYRNDAGAIATINATTLMQNARQNGTITVPITALISRVDIGNGPEQSGGRVRGFASVTYLGRGRGYAVAPVVENGDTATDRLQCNCADYRANYDCVHVRQTAAELQNRLNAPSLRERPDMARVQAIVNADLARDRAESITAQNNAVATWGESENSYINDPAAFQREYRAAKRRLEAGEQPVAYMTENATDGLGARGTGRAFGVELEFDFPSGVNHGTALANIGAELHRAGLTRSAAQTGYHAAEYRGYTENHQGGWSFERDGTVAGEIVSPIMYDEPQTWENIAKVCEIVRRHGGQASVRAGSHIHVGLGDFDHTVENHNRLMRTFAANEDLIYRLSSNPERGTHRGPSWCSPNRVPSEGYTNVGNVRSSNNGHHLGVNWQSVRGANSDHVEFRTWDSSLDPAVIQTQIKVSLAMAASALRDRDDSATSAAEREPLGSHRTRNREDHGNTRRLTGEAWAADTASFRGFADRMFRRASDKAQLTSLFAVTKWQRGR